MKNIKFFLLLISLTTFFSTHAQTKPVFSEEKKNEMVTQLKADKEKLALSPEQEIKYIEIYKKYASKLKELKSQESQSRSKFKEFRALKNQKDTEIKGILSDTQFKTYLEIQDERKSRAMENRRS